MVAVFHLQYGPVFCFVYVPTSLFLSCFNIKQEKKKGCRRWKKDEEGQEEEKMLLVFILRDGFFLNQTNFREMWYTREFASTFLRNKFFASSYQQ